MIFSEFAEEFGKVLALEPEEIRSLAPETRFRELPAWDSLAVISLIVLLDTKYKVRVTGHDFKALSTLGDFLKLTRK